MNRVTGLFFLVFGLGLVLVALQGLARGWLPNGPNGFRQGEGVSKEEQPIAFWFFFLVYSCGGAYLVLLALRIFSGHAAQ